MPLIVLSFQRTVLTRSVSAVDALVGNREVSPPLHPHSTHITLPSFLTLTPSTQVLSLAELQWCSEEPWRIFCKVSHIPISRHIPRQIWIPWRVLCDHFGLASVDGRGLQIPSSCPPSSALLLSRCMYSVGFSSLSGERRLVIRHAALIIKRKNSRSRDPHCIPSSGRKVKDCESDRKHTHTHTLLKYN